MSYFFETDVFDKFRQQNEGGGGQRLFEQW